VFVEPLLSAVINGSPLLIKGRARPFAPTREAVVDLDLDRIDLPKYLEYLPFEPRFRMPAAQLDLHLQASFQQPQERAPALILSGRATLRSLQLTAPDGAPILALPEFVVELGKADLLGGRIEVSRVAAAGLDLNVIKDGHGGLNLQLLAPPDSRRPQQPPRAGGADAGSAPGAPAFHVAIVRSRSRTRRCVSAIAARLGHSRLRSSSSTCGSPMLRWTCRQDGSRSARSTPAALVSGCNRDAPKPSRER